MTSALARKTRRAFLFVLSTSLLLGLIVSLELNSYEQSVQWIVHTNTVLSTLDHLMLAVARAESAQRGYLLTHGSTYTGWYVRARTEAREQMSQIQTLTRDNAVQQKILKELETCVEQRFQTLELLIDQPISAIRSDPSGSATLEGTAVIQRIWDLTRRSTAEETRLLASRSATERHTKVSVTASFVIFFLVNLGVLLWAYRIITEYGRARELAAEQILRLNSELEQRVTERTSELEIANAQLLRSNEDLTRFAYVASHDLQEPLRTIGSYVGLLGKRYQGSLDEQADRYIKFAVDGAKRMQALIHDLLVYSKIGTDALKLKAVNMDLVLQHVRDNLDLLIREEQASIESAPLPTLIADEIRMTQVFMNLLSNAIKFRKPDVAPSIKIESTRIGEEWIFCISDNGLGFDQQHAERIFVLFQRLHSVGAYPGTGMGLAICKRIVEQHRGRIWVTSKPNEGSSFWFTIAANLSPKLPSNSPVV